MYKYAGSLRRYNQPYINVDNLSPLAFCQVGNFYYADFWLEVYSEEKSARKIYIFRGHMFLNTKKIKMTDQC